MASSVASDEVRVYESPTVVETHTDFADAANIVVRIRARKYLALVVREPKGVGKLTGSGLASPTFA